MRAKVRNRRFKSHLNGNYSWHHEFYFCEKRNHIVHYCVFTPKTYWKLISNRKIRRTEQVFDYAYYRKVFNLWGLY